MRRPTVDGYDSALIAQVVAAKTSAAQPALLDWGSAARVLTAVGLTRPRRVLDFGGGAGWHYLTVRRAFPDVDLTWAVVETPSMVQAATTVGPSFHTTIEDAVGALGAVDLVFTSGALQYTPDPVGVLRQLAAVAGAVFVTRVAVSPDGARRRLVQESRLADNGPGPLPDGFEDRPVRYPVTLVDAAEYEAALGCVRLRFDEGGERAGRQVVPMRGWFRHSP